VFFSANMSWEVELEGGWAPFYADVEAKLEAAFISGSDTFDFIANNRQYSVDLDQMVQKNCASNQTRAIQRAAISSIDWPEPTLLTSRKKRGFPVLFNKYDVPAKSLYDTPVKSTQDAPVKSAQGIQPVRPAAGAVWEVDRNGSWTTGPLAAFQSEIEQAFGFNSREWKHREMGKEYCINFRKMECTFCVYPRREVCSVRRVGSGGASVPSRATIPAKATLSKTIPSKVLVPNQDATSRTPALQQAKPAKVSEPKETPPKVLEPKKRGKVASFFEDRGFGFIAPDDASPDVYFVSSSLNCDRIVRGDTVEYYLGSRRGKVEATAVTVAKKPQGRVKAFFEDKGYGFIMLDDGVELFFHMRSLRSGKVSKGDTVECNVSGSKDKPEATAIVLVSKAPVMRLLCTKAECMKLKSRHFADSCPVATQKQSKPKA